MDQKLAKRYSRADGLYGVPVIVHHLRDYNDNKGDEQSPYISACRAYCDLFLNICSCVLICNVSAQVQRMRMVQTVRARADVDP